jgi:hypothetical protein
MADDLITLNRASAMLSEMIVTIDSSLDPAEVLRVEQAAKTMKEWLRRARWGRDWQNKFAVVSFRAIRRFGQMRTQMEKNVGGRPPSEKPVLGEDGFSPTPVTNEELGISRNFSSEAQQIGAMPDEDFEEFIALTTDDQGEAEQDRPYMFYENGEFYRPLELNKKQLLQWARHKAAERSNAASKARAAEQALKDADRIAAQPIPPQSKNRSYQPPPLPPPPRQKPPIAKTIPILKTMLHPNTGPGEVTAAVEALRRIDPHAESFGSDTSVLDRLVEDQNKFYNLAQERGVANVKLQNEIENYKARERKHLLTIRELKKENDRLDNHTYQKSNYREDQGEEEPINIFIERISDNLTHWPLMPQADRDRLHGYIDAWFKDVEEGMEKEIHALKCENTRLAWNMREAGFGDFADRELPPAPDGERLCIVGRLTAQMDGFTYHVERGWGIGIDKQQEISEDYATFAEAIEAGRKLAEKLGLPLTGDSP